MVVQRGQQRDHHAGRQQPVPAAAFPRPGRGAAVMRGRTAPARRPEAGHRPGRCRGPLARGRRCRPVIPRRAGMAGRCRGPLLRGRRCRPCVPQLAGITPRLTARWHFLHDRAPASQPAAPAGGPGTFSRAPPSPAGSGELRAPRGAQAAACCPPPAAVVLLCAVRRRPAGRYPAGRTACVASGFASLAAFLRMRCRAAFPPRGPGRGCAAAVTHTGVPARPHPGHISMMLEGIRFIQDNRHNEGRSCRWRHRGAGAPCAGFPG